MLTRFAFPESVLRVASSESVFYIPLENVQFQTENRHQRKETNVRGCE